MVSVSEVEGLEGEQGWSVLDSPSDDKDNASDGERECVSPAFPGGFASPSATRAARFFSILALRC